MNGHSSKLVRAGIFIFPLLGIPICALFASVPASHEPARTPFEHYQPILDRMPFGVPPPEAQPELSAEQAKDAAEVQAEQQKLAKQINMSCINVTPSGVTAVGFTDLDAKPPVNFYLLVGASGGGWTLLKADYDEEWAQLEKDGVTITLKLGKGLVDSPTEAAPVAEAKPAQAPVATTPSDEQKPTNPLRLGAIRRPSHTGVPPVPGISGQKLAEMEKRREELQKLREAGGDVTSYIERLRERQKEEKAQREAAEQEARNNLQAMARKITEDEFKKREREINLRLIEQGARPVSDIELTQEEETALIQKGVLAQ